MDYFGTVVNVAARLCGQCTGSDIVLSTAICADPEVRAFLDSPSGPPQRMDRVQLKGLGETPIEICRLSDV